jgi:hypothetical protein
MLNDSMISKKSAIKSNYNIIKNHYILIIEDFEDQYKEGDFKEAEEYANMQRFVQLDGENLKEMTMGTANQEFKKFGVGIYLFLDFLKQMTIITLVMAIIMSPVIYFNFVSQTYDFVIIYL